MSNHVGQKLGNYHLIRLLGRGGFAEVYLGEHSQLKVPAAIKILHTHIADAELSNFRREAQTIAQLRHPHIIRVFDFDLQDGTPFLVMDYALNGPLLHLHPRGTVLPVPMVISYVKQIAEALQYAHNQGFIHRDIKPENVLMGQHREILLGDFGIAMMSRNTTTISAQVIAGTAPYMAPEQIQGKPVLASDQYSLGIMVYEWLTGVRPFVGTSTEVGMQHLLVAPPPLSLRNANIPPHVEQVVLIALAKGAPQRFPDVLSFATALERSYQDALEGRPVSFTMQSSPPTTQIGSVPPTLPAVPLQAKSIPPTYPAFPPQPANPISSTFEVTLPGKNQQPIASTSGDLANAYRAFRKQVEEEIDRGRRKGALIAVASESQVGKLVSLLSGYYWEGYPDQRSTSSAIEHVRIKQYTINGRSIAAAIFKELREEDYHVWIDIKKPMLAPVSLGEAVLVSLDTTLSTVVNQANASLEAFIPAQADDYEMFHKKVEEEIDRGRRKGALIAVASENQLGELVSLLSDYYWEGYPDQRATSSAIEHSRIKQHTINGRSIAAAIFNGLREEDYHAWIDIKKPILAPISLGEAIIIRLPL